MIDIIFEGEFVIVGALSQKGKNRIHEHGMVWKVKRCADHAILLESTDGQDYWRWVNHKDDPDFELLKIVNPDNL